MRPDTAGIEQTGVASQCVFNSPQHCRPQRTTKPHFLRGGKPELVAPIANLLREDTGHCAAQNALRIATHHLMAIAKRDAELDKAVIEEWHARLDAMSHAVAI